MRSSGKVAALFAVLTMSLLGFGAAALADPGTVTLTVNGTNYGAMQQQQGNGAWHLEVNAPLSVGATGSALHNGTTYPWGQQGRDNLPCESGGLFVFTPSHVLTLSHCLEGSPSPSPSPSPSESPSPSPTPSETPSPLPTEDETPLGGGGGPGGGGGGGGAGGGGGGAGPSPVPGGRGLAVTGPADVILWAIAALMAAGAGWALLRSGKRRAVGR